MDKLVKIFAGSLVVLIVVLLAVYLIISPKKDSFVEDVKDCNLVEKELRFSCFRAAIEKHYAGKAEEFSKKIKQENDLIFKNKKDDEEDVTYAIFGTNCHTFYHAAGDFIASNTPIKMSLKDKLGLGVTSCTSGYMMGLYKRTALMNNYSDKIMKQLFTSCGNYGTHQCAHEVGHILHDKYTYSILKTLDGISEKEYGLKPAQKFKYTQNFGNDLNGPFEDCKKILIETEWNYCFTGVGHNLFLFAEFSKDGYKSVFNECKNVKPENEENCYAFIIYRVGINEAAPRVLSGETNEGIRVCEEVIKLSGYENLRKHCFIGIGGGIGLFADSEFTALKVDDNNIKHTRERMHLFIDYCKSLDENDIDDCIAGLFGTPFSKHYKRFLIKDPRVDSILDKLDKDFQVVG